MFQNNPFFYLLFLVVLFISLSLFWIFKRYRERQSFITSLKLKLLLIKLSPDFEAKNSQAQNPLQEINLTSQFFSLLANFKMPFAVEAAVHGIGEDINFYLAVPNDLTDFASKAINGLWPEAEVTEVSDYNIFNPKGYSQGAFLKLKESYFLPIRTFNEINLDTFAPILSNFSKLQKQGEGMALQLVIMPAPKWAAKNVNGAIHNLRKGTKLSDILKPKLNLFSDIFSFGNQNQDKKEQEIKLVDENAVKALEQKISKPLFSVNARIIISANDQGKTKELLDGLINSFSQFAGPLKNEFKFQKISRPEKFNKFIFRQFDDSQKMILSSDEISSIFHFPTSTLKIPNINWLRFKEAPPPLEVSGEGIYAGKGVYIGDSAFRGETKPIYLTDEDRLKHIYIIGQTGTGKSNLLNILARSDIKKGGGLAIIDPHGSLIEFVLGAIPKERQDDVIIFDPSDIEMPVGLNMLEYNFDYPEQKTFVVNELFSMLDKLYDMKLVGGPMFEQYMKNSILLLMEDMVNEPATLMEIPRIFIDDDFRKRKLSRIKNPIVVDFWEKEAISATGDHSLANMSPYITSKFNNFIANDYMRPIIGQTKSALNFRKIMDEGKILLVNLSKGKIGDINANLLGMIFVGKILMAAFSRSDVPEHQRRVFNLYIDEFQNFTTDTIAIILAEARKYRLSLTIAHQFIAQLQEKVRDAVFGNVGSVVAFRVGLSDVEFLSKHFEPVFSKRDLTSIDNLNAYARILIHGKLTAPFNIKMKYEGNVDLKLAEGLKEMSRLSYGRPREEVEMEILRRMRM